MWGPHWKHVMDHWKLRNDPNLLFLTYEDMKADLLNVIQRISAFLGKKLGPDGEKSLAEHVSFESMKSNEAVAFEKNYAQVTERVLKPVTELGLSLDNLIAIAVDGRMSRVPVGKILKLVVSGKIPLSLPVTELGLSLDNLIAIAVDGRMSRVPVGKILKLVVSGKIPLSLVSALVAARLQNRPVRITASQISAMTGGSLTPEFCSDMLEIGGYSAPVPSPDVVVTPKPTSATTTTTTTTTPTSAMTTTSSNKKANKKKTEKSSKPVSSVSVLDANPSPDPAVKPKKRNNVVRGISEYSQIQAAVLVLLKIWDGHLFHLDNSNKMTTRVKLNLLLVSGRKNQLVLASRHGGGTHGGPHVMGSDSGR
ncbi:unnamed protein product, partial [Notodromas monacha]